MLEYWIDLIHLFVVQTRVYLRIPFVGNVVVFIQIACHWVYQHGIQASRMHLNNFSNLLFRVLVDDVYCLVKVCSAKIEIGEH